LKGGHLGSDQEEGKEAMKKTSESPAALHSREESSTLRGKMSMMSEVRIAFAVLAFASSSSVGSSLGAAVRESSKFNRLSA